jgi:hypothetical protein
VIDPEKLRRQNIIIKEMPEGIKFEASIWFIEDTLVIFSGKPPFIVAIKHGPIAESLKSIYDFLWEISKPPATKK